MTDNNEGIVSCPVCLELYNRSMNPPYSCVPCGHVICKPCLDMWFSTNSGRKCPMCRDRTTATMLNRNLIDLLESNSANSNSNTPTNDNHSSNSSTNPSAPPPPLSPISARRRNSNRSGDNIFVLPDSSTIQLAFQSQRDRTNELIFDKSEFVYYIIDNSGSMQSNDAKKFTDVRIDKHEAIKLGAKVISDNSAQTTPFFKTIKEGYGSCTRWQEAAGKTMQIAEYNIKRGMKGTYYLLNPVNKSVGWQDELDYIVIDPVYDQAVVAGKMEILRTRLLNERNIRGTTPLDKILIHLKSELRRSSHISGFPININFLTDGCPDRSDLFVMQLRSMSTDTDFSIFITINLCTDDDSVVDYYNDLDAKLGNEISGLEVLDDLESERLEILKAGNNFFTYCNEIHIARMAGCNSIIADILDETKMNMFHVSKFVKEVLRISGNPRRVDLIPWNENINGYITQIESENRYVYCIYSKKYKKLIDTSILRKRAKSFQTNLQLEQLWAQYENLIYIIIAVIGIVMYALLEAFKKKGE